MSKKLLVILWILLSAVLPACSTLTPEQKAMRTEDRAFEKRMVEAAADACVASGNVWMADNRNERGSCVSREEYRRWMEEFTRHF